MCGIAGWYCYGDARPTVKEVKELLKALEVRGVDASGVAWNANDTNYIMRAPGKPTDFVEREALNKDIQEISDSKWGFLHSRQATHGSSKNNLNNHPIMNPKGIIIHNGVVNFKSPKIAARGETDTEQLMLNIQEKGWGTALKDYYGSAAFAYKDLRFKGFYLYTDGNSPLVWAKDATRKILFFCSTVGILEKALGKMDTKTVEPRKVFYISDKATKVVATIKKEYEHVNNTCNFARSYQGHFDEEWHNQGRLGGYYC